MIKTANLVKTFDKFTALENLNINIPKGSVYGLVGPNGAGKSTVIRCITGIYKQDSGEVLVDSKPVWENPAVKEKIGYIPDDIFYFGNASTNDMMHFYKGIYENFDYDKYLQLKDIFSIINPKTPIRRLSKGMQKQSAFWLALCLNADLLVLDEPVDGLDPVMRRQIWSLIMSDVSERNTTVLVSSHNLRELEDVCDHVGIMQNGRLLLEHSLVELQENICKIQIAFDGEKPDWPKRLNILHESNIGRIITLIVRESPTSALKQLEPLSPILIEPLPLTLEEIFIYELGGTGYECKDIVL